MDTTIFRSLLAINPNTNFPISTNFLLSTDGLGDLVWNNVFTTISTQDSYVAFLPSTIYTMSNFMYNISTGVLPGSLSTPNLTSTVKGLGNAGYVSTATLFSTVTGLGNIYLSTLSFASTVDGLGTLGYISSTQLNSTIDGLGKRYISTASLQSTIDGLGSKYISTTSLASTIDGLGSRYISTASLTSTLNGLGTYGYPSSTSLYSSINGTNSNLVSSITDILDTKLNYYYNQVGSLVLAGYNMNVTISTISSFYFYDSFFNSSITYKGNNGLITASTNVLSNNDMYISTLVTQLDSFSSFIHKTTNVSLEVYPNIVFSQINTNSNPQIYHVSTFLTYNRSTINVLHQTKCLAMNNTASNIFQQPIRLNISGNLLSNYIHPYVLTHRFINAYSYGTNVGFISPNVDSFFDSTSSYYLSIQNIAP